MTIRISDLQRDDVRALEVPYDGDVVKLSYRPATITADFEEEIQGLLESNRGAGATARALSEVVVSWDVTDAEGQPWPPTLENLRTLNYAFTNALLTAILADAQKPAPPTTNGHGSETAVAATRRTRR